jgi:hypothetical protein
MLRSWWRRWSADAAMLTQRDYEVGVQGMFESDNSANEWEKLSLEAERHVSEQKQT